LRIYLDVCCLGRPFDNQEQDKVYLEGEAILRILENCKEGSWSLVSSPVVDFEINQIKDEERRKQLRTLAEMAKEKLESAEEIKKRAKELENNGIKAFDASHLAFAEAGKVDYFFTTDSRFLKKAKTVAQIKVMNPLEWYGKGE